jgi:hypothetical protein
LTNFARSVHPEVRIVEAEADASVDCIRRERGLQHVRLLILEDAKDTFAFLKGARQTSDEECLEMVLLRWESGHDLSAVSTALFEFGFALFRLHERSLEQIMPNEPSGAGSYLAVRRGFAPPFPEIGRTGS